MFYLLTERAPRSRAVATPNNCARCFKHASLVLSLSHAFHIRYAQMCCPQALSPNLSYRSQPPLQANRAEPYELSEIQPAALSRRLRRTAARSTVAGTCSRSMLTDFMYYRSYALSRRRPWRAAGQPRWRPAVRTCVECDGSLPAAISRSVLWRTWDWEHLGPNAAWRKK